MIRHLMLAAAALCLSLGTAVAQAPVQMRGGGIQGQARNSTWTIRPDGIAHFANIDPASGLGGISVDSLVQKFSIALSQADIGSRIAGVDASGNVTAPVNTPGVDTPTVALGDLLDTGRTSFRSMIDGQSILRVSAAHRQANPAGEDPWTDPDGVVIGGLATGRGSHVVMTCQDEGGMNLGACLSLWNSNDTYTGNRPGLSPTTGAQIASYNAFDAVVVDNGTKSTTPKIVASSAFTSSDGVRHSVFFDSGSVWISPVLSDADRAKLKQHQTIISNVSTPDYVNRLDSYGTYAVNGFSGMLDNWSFSLPCPSGFAGASVCDQLDVDTWVIPGSGNAATTNPQTYATTASNLDTHYDASATSPAIYLGARTKQFNHLLTCELGDYDTAPNDAGVDALHSLMRECENGEYDNELHTAISGKYHFNGLTIGVDSHTKGTQWVDGTAQTDGYNAWPDKTSWGVYLGGQLPNLLVLSPFTSDFVQAIAGNTFNVTNPISAGVNPGDTALMTSLFKNAGTSSMILNQWQQCDAATGSTCPDHNAMSMRIGLRVGGTIGSLTNGAPGANMAFGGDGSLKLCTAGGSCAVQDSNGNWSVIGNLTVGQGISANYINVDGIGANTEGGNITVTAFTVFNKGLQSSYVNVDGIGAATAGGDVTVTAHMAANAGIDTKFVNTDGIGAKTAGGDITITAHTVANAGLDSTFVNTDGIGAKTAGGPLTITAPIQENKDLTVSGTLTANGPAEINAGMDVNTGNLTIKSGWLQLPGQSILMASGSGTSPYVLLQVNANGELAPTYGSGGSGAYASPNYPYADLPGVAAGTKTPTVGASLYCTDCYSSSNAAKTLRIPVWWNGSAWTDAVGQVAQH